MYTRKHKRFALVATADVVAVSDRRSLTGLVANVSPEGMGFYLSDALPAGTEVQVTLGFLGGEQEDALETVSGTVRWSVPLGSSHAVGVQLHEISPVKHPCLSAYLSQPQMPEE